jgi:hypothetical protein
MPLRSAFSALDESASSGEVDTYRRLSSSSLMMQVAPVLLHCAHSVSPSRTTHRILLSRQDTQAMDARCRTCCLLDDRVEGAGLNA